MKTSLRQYCIAHGRDTLLREWDAARNGGLTPSDVSFGSHQKIWWRCPAGHSYDSVVKSRVQGTGCPVCAGRVILPDENSLAARYPALVAEWDTEKKCLPAPDAGRRGDVEKGLVEMPQGAQLFRLCRVPCARLRLSGLWGKGGRPRRKRPRFAVPAARRSMGRCEKRRPDAGDGAPWLQPPRVVVLRKRTFLPRRHLPPRAERERLSLLHQSQGVARLQRPRGHRAGHCLAMAPDAQRQPYAATGDVRQQPQGLVALRKGACVAGERQYPHGKAALRLSDLRGQTIESMHSDSK